MFSSLKKFFTLPSFLQSFFKGSKQDKQQNIRRVHTRKLTNLSPKKQEELERLCEQLFKKKELLSSGKFQFIGLAKIKKRLGRKWNALCRLVYKTAEDVIDKYLEKGDIFVRYKDDTYIVIFCHASPEESRLKSSLIAEEIRRRLFELEEKELRDLEIRQAVKEVRTGMLQEADFLDDMLGMVELEFQNSEQEIKSRPVKDPEPEIETVEVQADDYKPPYKSKTVHPSEVQDFQCGYLPLWETNRNALTTYLSLPQTLPGEEDLFKQYQALYAGKSYEIRAEYDKIILQKLMAELQNMEKAGRKFFMVCPVQHNTVYRMQTYEPYKSMLARIPEIHRKFLFLLVMDIAGDSPPENAYWFAKSLRTLVPGIFVELPMQKKINFSYLANAGVNVAGIRLEKEKMPEQDAIKELNTFGIKAKAAKMPKTFVLQVSTLSLTTSAVCAGFDYLGGSAIHAPVNKPDSVYRYQHADLIKNLKT